MNEWTARSSLITHRWGDLERGTLKTAEQTAVCVCDRDSVVRFQICALSFSCIDALETDTETDGSVHGEQTCTCLEHILHLGVSICGRVPHIHELVSKFLMKPESQLSDINSVWTHTHTHTRASICTFSFLAFTNLSRRHFHFSSHSLGNFSPVENTLGRLYTLLQMSRKGLGNDGFPCETHFAFLAHLQWVSSSAGTLEAMLMQKV